MSTTTAETSKPHGRIKIETGAKRVCAYLGGEVVADTLGGARQAPSKVESALSAEDHVDECHVRMKLRDQRAGPLTTMAAGRLTNTTARSSYDA